MRVVLHCHPAAGIAGAAWCQSRRDKDRYRDPLPPRPFHRFGLFSQRQICYAACRNGILDRAAHASRIFAKQIRPKLRPALEKLTHQGRIELIEGNVELYPGLELLKAGGHTPGSQMVALDTSAGKPVLCGDIAYTFKNVRDHVPVGWYHNLADTVVALERALTTEARPDLAFPNHDAEIIGASAWCELFEKARIE
jgi:glyoxylase-like metal-dependent hydrolase (beta-lactamase superfamily II)